MNSAASPEHSDSRDDSHSRSTEGDKWTSSSWDRSDEWEKGTQDVVSNDAHTEALSDPPSQPGNKREIWIMTTVLLAVFLNALDRTIIYTAVPRISDEFHALGDIGWYNASFMLAAACSQLIFGRIYTYNPPKFVFITLVGLFEAGNLVCGAAPTSASFIVGRAIAGMGSAGLMCGAIVVMVSTVSLSKRPLYQGFFGAVFTLASIIGPVIGGALTTNVSWRWCFYLNVPIGCAVMLVIFFVLDPIPPVQPGLSIREQITRMDPVGEVFLVASVACLILGLAWGGNDYAWKDWRIITLFAVAGVSLIAFGVVQYCWPDTATIPAATCSVRGVTMGLILTFFLNGTLQLMTYYQPTWFQAVRGVSPEKSGVYSLAIGIPTMSSTLFAGIAVQRVGYYTPFAIISSVITPIGAGLFVTLRENTSDAKWIGYSILLGCGMGIGMNQAATACQTILPPEEVPIALSLNFLFQSLAGAIFVPIGQTVLNSQLLSGLKSSLPGLDPAIITKAGATGWREVVPDAVLSGVVEVYNDALTKVFLVGAVCGALSLVGSLGLEWRSVKGKQGNT
ncbi:HC-toxin efflux carrier TOXA [Lecanosticta acicola]|uniref:HC-toxin efflux carrier TOXA n=1 Tax=Lecanosticta acicola TaxID=111012 RepID=A0AAI8YY92_9PEZI|nr:HC-toxin efflux carrier TOXA [Lecanosticta acicola]